MLSIKYNNNLYELDFEGIKIFETNYTTNVIKNIFSIEDGLMIDGKKYTLKNIIYINEMTKIDEFLSLGKNNYLYKKILEKLDDRKLINDIVINEIIDQLNNELEINNLLSTQYDINRIINGVFELNDLGFISDENFLNILNKIDYEEKKLIIFDNCKYINYERIKKLLNNFNVMIFCSDIRNVISNYKEFEICCYLNENLFEIISIERLISFLEFKISEPISEKDLNLFLNFDSSKKSNSINFYLKNL